MDKDIIIRAIDKEVTLILSNGFNYDGVIKGIKGDNCRFVSRDKEHYIDIKHIINIIFHKPKEENKSAFEFPAKKTVPEKLRIFGERLEKVGSKLAESI